MLFGGRGESHASSLYQPLETPVVLLLLPSFSLAFSGPGFSGCISESILCCLCLYVELSWKMSIWAASNNSSLPERHKGNRNILVWVCLCMCVLKSHMYASVHTYTCVYMLFCSQSTLLMGILSTRNESLCWQTKPHPSWALIAVLQDGERLSSRSPSADSCYSGGWMWRIHFRRLYPGRWEGCGAQNNSRMRSCQQGVWVDKYNHAPLSFQGNYS